jgi:ubiquinone/menaquinone biosynthesis C-methylase UbiE
MESYAMYNRHEWNAAEFHHNLAEIAGITHGETVLDLGCGTGASLPALLDHVGLKGYVYALDRMPHAIEQIQKCNKNAIHQGRLFPVVGDVSQTTFQNGSFDAIVCQNVIECLLNEKACLTEIQRILRPGGKLLLGHHDFDGIMLSGANRELTRHLVHGFADHVQNWQDKADGQMGRRLPGLVAKVGFTFVEIEMKVYVELNMKSHTYAAAYVKWLEETLVPTSISQNNFLRWRNDLEESVRQEKFFFALPWVGVKCMK